MEEHFLHDNNYKAWQMLEIFLKESHELFGG